MLVHLALPLVRMLFRRRPRFAPPPPPPRRSGAAVNLLAFGGVTLLGFLAVRQVVHVRRKFDLTGRVAVVTGGTSGIGLAVARELLRRGARVAVASRGEAKTRAAVEQLKREGLDDVFGESCDVTRPDEVARFFSEVRAHFGGPVDVLVNAQGTILVAPIEHVSADDYRRTMDANLFGALHTMLEAAPSMRERKVGRIANVASIGGKVPGPHMAPYAASKFALVGLSATWRAELQPHGVYVTTVNPGLVSAGSTKNALFKGRHAEEKAWFEAADNAPEPVTIAPERLARQIVDALVVGDAELTTPLAARVQATLHGLAPGVSTELAGLFARFALPKPTGPAGDAARKGADVDATAHTGAGTERRQRENETRHQATAGG